MKARTKQEALQHILAELDAGRLGAQNEYGGCVYESKDGKHCGVGCLFTPEQHAWIKQRKLGHLGVGSLSEFVGRNNLFHMTGMSVEELRRIQRLHDDTSHNGITGAFRDYLVRESN
jgi:hypothetical protein